MSRTFAFLRAINVGGHTVKMDRLKELFEGMGLENVETFIASGNVIFDTPRGSAAALEKKIEKTLAKALGFEVATFVRTDAELAAVVAYPAFPLRQIEAATAYNIAFMAAEPEPSGLQRLLAMQTDLDMFHIHGRELYWLSQVKQSESKISNAVFEKALGQPSTLRQVSTIRKMAKKYPPVR